MHIDHVGESALNIPHYKQPDMQWLGMHRAELPGWQCCMLGPLLHTVTYCGSRLAACNATEHSNEVDTNKLLMSTFAFIYDSKEWLCCGSPKSSLLGSFNIHSKGRLWQLYEIVRNLSQSQWSHLSLAQFRLNALQKP